MPRRRCRLLIAIIDLDGGAGAFCRTLATGLKRYFGDEFRITLLLCRRRGLLPDDRNVFDRIHILYTDVHTDRRRYYESIVHALRMRFTIGRIGTDVILTVGTYANLLVPFASPARRSILTVHSNTTKLLDDSRYGGVIARLVRWRFPRSPVVSPSAGVARDLHNRFNVRRTVVIPHGIDADRVRALADEPVDDLPVRGEPYIVACGRLTAAKDYPTMLRAYAIARPRGLTDPLVIIGGGEDHSSLVALSHDLRISSSVHFLGHRDNPYRYMRQAKLFVLSSVFEGFGLALVEAMTLGLPCLSTDCPSGPAEVLDGGKFGVLVPPSDPEALANALVELRGSPDRLAFFAKQSRIRAEDFSLARMARQYRDLLLQR